MQADTAQVTECSRQTGPAVERHARSRHVRVPGTLRCFRFQLPVSVAMPTACVGWTAWLIVEQRLQFFSICIYNHITYTTFRKKATGIITVGLRIYLHVQTAEPSGTD